VKNQYVIYLLLNWIKLKFFKLLKKSFNKIWECFNEFNDIY